MGLPNPILARNGECIQIGQNLYARGTCSGDFGISGNSLSYAVYRDSACAGRTLESQRVSNGFCEEEGILWWGRSMLYECFDEAIGADDEGFTILGFYMSWTTVIWISVGVVAFCALCSILGYLYKCQMKLREAEAAEAASRVRAVPGIAVTMGPLSRPVATSSTFEKSVDAV